jgi:hypothetical protein
VLRWMCDGLQSGCGIRDAVRREFKFTYEYFA